MYWLFSYDWIFKWEPQTVYFPQAVDTGVCMMLTDVCTTKNMLELYCGIGKKRDETKAYLASLE